MAERFVTFCSSLHGLFRTLTGNPAPQAAICLHGLIQARPPAKNMERMEEAVAGADYDRLHHFISHSPWQALPVMDHVAREVSHLARWAWPANTIAVPGKSITVRWGSLPPPDGAGLSRGSAFLSAGGLVP